jgi:NAD(P)-dependent dehydrogenase (short-subunit alcohol dehydrogenase family)
MDALQGDLSGRRALVVGGSGGIGAALCREMVKRGASLIVHGGSSAERLEGLVIELKAKGAAVEGFLSELEPEIGSVDRFVRALKDLGRIDILAVTFGPFLRKSLAETSAADWARLALFDLALPGALASSFFPVMAERGWGRILLFGGTRTDGIRAYSTNAAYAAAKTGLAVLAKSLAVEGSGKGVGAVLVCPGLVDTEYLSARERLELAAKAPGGRLLPPGRVAQAAVDLIAADPCLASGSAVTLDGGLAF